MQSFLNKNSFGRHLSEIEANLKSYIAKANILKWKNINKYIKNHSDVPIGELPKLTHQQEEAVNARIIELANIIARKSILDAKNHFYPIFDCLEDDLK